MRLNDESPVSPLQDVDQAAPDQAKAPFPPSGNDDGFLSRFPEAVAAGALADGQPVRRGGPGRGFRVMLYAALAVGAVAGLSLMAAWFLQAVLTGSYLRGGGDYFGSGIEASAARELLSVPVGGFIAVLLLCLTGMCVGVWGIQRSKAAPAL